jgi:hypothetical protein
VKQALLELMQQALLELPLAREDKNRSAWAQKAQPHLAGIKQGPMLAASLVQLYLGQQCLLVLQEQQGSRES